MKNRLSLLAALLVAGLTSACTINTSDLEEALKVPEVTPEVKASFESAISTVTDQVIDAAMEAADDATAVAAPAFSKQTLRRLADTAQAGETITINASKTTEDGGTITVTGTITASGTDATGNVNLNLKAEWANLSVTDGTTTQKTTGNETITGTMSWTADTFAVNLGLKGSFTLGSESYAFDIAMTMEGDKLVYTGTVNGQTVDGKVAAGDSAGTNDAEFLSCVGTNQVCSGGTALAPQSCSNITFCIEFADTRWTSTDVSSICAPAEYAPCSTAGLLGVCTGLKDGKTYRYHSYSADDKTQADCEAEGGVWTANN